MQEFMHEKISYVEDNYAENLFSNYTGQKRNEAINDLKNTIRILKFYSNNDFTFKDVHNEDLFYQNGKILVEMVQLFEKYRIVYPSKHQFLGDLFEQLLNKGFKQNEGQFFTPMPITRFIWDSLPIQKKIYTEKGLKYPKVIDYACGAGHFLTEAVETINEFAKTNGNNTWVKEHIFGIEKDYRLARVSKISMFMNGAGGANIVFGDGLENQPDKGIENKAFDILVANPPYAVKDFKQHLQLKNNSFELFNRIGDNSGEIEVLFVERIVQLLKPNGIAAVILPASILNNDASSYIGAREQLLQNFKIRTIVQFGSKTFSATGTNTVVLFLEKYDEPPKRKDMIRDSVSAILSGEELKDFEDKEIFDQYIAQIDIDETTYCSFTNRSLTMEEISKNKYLNTYLEAFRQDPSYKIIINKKAFHTLHEKEKQKIILNNFYEFAFSREKEKLFYFALTYTQNTLIISAPADNAKQREFLGYDWSNRKGAEGILINTPGGKLYCDNNRTAKNTLASAIRNSFSDKSKELSEENAKYANFVKTKDLLDFSRSDFNKAIRTSINKKMAFSSIYKLDKIKNIVPLIESGSRPKGGVNKYKQGAFSVGGEHIDNKNGKLNLTVKKYVPQDFYNEATSGKIKENDILICKDGALTGKIAIVKKEFNHSDAMVNEHVFLLRCKNLITQKYVFNFLYSTYGQTILKANRTGSAQGGLNRTNLEQIEIPVPSISVQQQIVDECEKINEEYNNTRMSIEIYRKKIENLFNELDVISTDKIL